MKAKTYQREYGEVIVEECTRKEFVELAQELVNEARYWENMADLAGLDYADYYAELDMAMTITYKDGSICTYHDGFGIEGKFRRAGIVYGEISNSCTYQVFGEYTVNEDMVVEPA